MSQQPKTQIKRCRKQRGEGGGGITAQILAPQVCGMVVWLPDIMIGEMGAD